VHFADRPIRFRIADFLLLLRLSSVLNKAQKESAVPGYCSHSRAQFPPTNSTYSRQTHSLKKARLLLALLPLRCILAGGQEGAIQMQQGYTFPGGCWRPFWGFPNWTPNICCETFHPSRPVKLLLILLKISFVCSGQLVLKIWKVSDLYLYQVVQHKSLIYLATSTIQTNIAKFYDEIK